MSRHRAQHTQHTHSLSPPSKTTSTQSNKNNTTKQNNKQNQADRSIESLYAELAASGVAARCPPAHVADYIGARGLVAAALERAGVAPEASMAQVRAGGREGRGVRSHKYLPLRSPLGVCESGLAFFFCPFHIGVWVRAKQKTNNLKKVRTAVAEVAVLPLGSQQLHERLPHARALLLHGPRGSGKALLARAAAATAGACLFDLSPAVVARCYPGKAAAALCHIVFKARR